MKVYIHFGKDHFLQPALAMCLALVGALFSATLVGVTYFQMKTPEPEADGFFKLQKDLAEPLGLGGWAKLQRSKGIRILSFVVALSVMLGCLAVATWQGYLAFALIRLSGS